MNHLSFVLKQIEHVYRTIAFTKCVLKMKFVPDHISISMDKWRANSVNNFPYYLNERFLHLFV